MPARRVVRSILVAALTVVAVASASQPAVGPPQVFGEGIVSTPAPEFAITFSPDGRLALFNRATDDRTRFDLFAARDDGTRWVPRPVEMAVRGASYLDPFITANGRRLFVSSNRGDGAPGSTRGDFDLWVLDMDRDSWSAPTRLGPTVNSSKNDVFCSLTARGDLYFASDRDGAMAIFVAEPDGRGSWSPARRVALDIPQGTAVSNPLIDAKGDRLIFAATLPDTAGGLDLYSSERRTGTWSRPRNLGAAVNSTYADFAPAWGPGERELFFTSERPGLAPARADASRPPGDIYRASRQALWLDKD
jgi:Tol biopolymer transport system component